MIDDIFINKKKIMFKYILILVLNKFNEVGEICHKTLILHIQINSCKLYKLVKIITFHYLLSQSLHLIKKTLIKISYLKLIFLLDLKKNHYFCYVNFNNYILISFLRKEIKFLIRVLFRYNKGSRQCISN